MSKPAKKQWYSVLLVYDSGVSEGCETYYDWTKAENASASRVAVTEKCVEMNKKDGREDFTANDLHCVLVIKGRHMGLDFYKEKKGKKA